MYMPTSPFQPSCYQLIDLKKDEDSLYLSLVITLSPILLMPSEFYS